MAESKRVELILGIKTVGAVDASQGLESITKVAAGISSELSKLERADVLTQLAVTAAQVAVETGDAAAATARLATELAFVGASEAEIRKVSKAFDSTIASIEKAQQSKIELDLKAEQAAQKAEQKELSRLEKIARAEASLRAKQEKQGAALAADIERQAEKQALLNAQLRESATGATTLQKSLGQIARADQINRLGTEMGLLAKKTKDEAGAVAELNKQLKELGSSDDEIRDAANAFAGAQAGGPSNRLGRIGSELRALPSQGIPGTNISTDQIAGIIRLGGALGVVSEKASETSLVAQTLAPRIGQTAAGLVSLGLSAGAVVAPVLLIITAFENFKAAMSQNVQQINSFADAQRAINERVASGSTTAQELARLQELDQRRREEEKTLATLQQAYDAADAAALELGVAQRDLARAFSGDEQSLADQIEASKKIISDTSAEYGSLKDAIDQGAFAANDAAEAEKKLAEERSKAALSSADVAGRELQAQQRALNATEEQNNKRLEAIEDEKAVLELQIKTLEESGVTSEEVTAKLAALNSQLGSLGNESEFIKNTALEVSRQADAAKKAQKDAEDAAKKAEQAQTQYTKAVDSAGKQYAQSIQDIGIRFRQVIADNQTKFNRDLTDVATKYRRDEYDLQIKANRAERDATQDQIADIRKIREDGRKEEQDALREGDFEALFLARQKQAETLEQEQTTLDDSRKQREQAAADAREDLLRNAQRQRQDRILAFDRQSMDARTAQSRDLQQAQLTRQRALQAAQEGYNAELALIGGYWQKRLQIEQQGIQQSLGMAAGQNVGANRTSTPQAMKIAARAIGGIIRR